MKYIIYIFLYLSVTSLASCQEKKSNFKEVLGLDFRLNREDYQYGDYMSFSGDGYSGVVYSVSEAELDSIVTSINIHQLPKEKEAYKRKIWTETPINKRNIITLVASYYTNDKKFLEFQSDVEKLLTMENNYFCYYYKETEGNIDDIRLYLLDTSSNKLYMVWHSV